MDTDALIGLIGHGLMVMLALSAPAVLTSLGVGFMISLFQAVTQIQEQTLTFVPKIIAVFAVILLSGAWMVSMITDFTQYTYSEVIRLIQ